LGDLDADGDSDLLSGSGAGTFFYRENAVLATLPVIDGPERVAVPMSRNASPKAFELTLDASDLLGRVSHRPWSVFRAQCCARASSNTTVRSR
jgi:hypothetical protein